jgi:cation diffusion facilitator CzcD-associated flavoprotein CzcO
MVQRHPTWVFPVRYYQSTIDQVYNRQVPTEISDILNMGPPMAIRRLEALWGCRTAANHDTEYFDALERRGFKTVRYGDLMSHLYERMGGHHLDVGAAALINDGRITVKSGATIVEYNETGLVFDDGITVDADVIVFATGFDGSLRRAVTEIVGSDIGNRLEDWWGCDAEGEVLGSWKPHPGQKNIWYQGGEIGNARFFSKFLALQIKAEIEGFDFNTYDQKP